MELITITNDIKRKLNLESCTFRYANMDIIATLKKLSLHNAIIVFPTIGFDIIENDKAVLYVKLGDSFVEIPVLIEDIQCTGSVIICEIFFEDLLLENLVEKLKKINRDLSLDNKRKEERITCTKENLEALKLTYKTSLVTDAAVYQGYIKDVSLSAIRLLTDKKMLCEEFNELFIKLHFYEPEQTIATKTLLVRKEEYIIDDAVLCQLVVSIMNSIDYKERIVDYFDKKKLIKRGLF